MCDLAWGEWELGTVSLGCVEGEEGTVSFSGVRVVAVLRVGVR